MCDIFEIRLCIAEILTIKQINNKEFLSQKDKTVIMDVFDDNFSFMLGFSDNRVIELANALTKLSKSINELTDQEFIDNIELFSIPQIKQRLQKYIA